MQLRNQKTNFEAASAYTEKLLAKAKIEEEKAIIEDIVLAIQKSDGLKANQIPELIGQKKKRDANADNISRLLKAERAGRIRWDYARKLWVGC